MKRTSKNAVPYVTFAIIGLTVVVMLVMRLFVPLSNTAEQSIFMGAYYKPMVLAGEWWRMITVMFVHGSFGHLLANCVSLFSLGIFLEIYSGSVRYLLVFLLSVLGGSLFVFVGDNTSVAVGMSAGIYGLFAWYLHLLYSSGKYKDPAMRNSISGTIFINLLINFLPGVSWIAHLGGFLFGLVASSVLVPYHKSTTPKHWAVAGILFMIAVTGLSYMRNDMGNTPVYLGTDINVLEAYQKVGLDGYSAHLARKLDDVYGTDVLEMYFGGDYE